MAQALFSFPAVIDHALGELIPLDKAAELSYWHSFVKKSVSSLRTSCTWLQYGRWADIRNVPADP